MFCTLSIGASQDCSFCKVYIHINAEWLKDQTNILFRISNGGYFFFCRDLLRIRTTKRQNGYGSAKNYYRSAKNYKDAVATRTSDLRIFADIRIFFADFRNLIAEIRTFIADVRKLLANIRKLRKFCGDFGLCQNSVRINLRISAKLRRFCREFWLRKNWLRKLWLNCGHLDLEKLCYGDCAENWT